MAAPMTLVFWLSCAFVAYIYAGYPALMAVRARLARRRLTDDVPASPAPSISIIVAARNEAARIAARVANLLSLDYPGAREIIVASDGSSDDTVSALQPFGRAVRVLDLPAHGKAAALNRAVASARHDIVVFADARQRFADDALVEITRPFTDPRVGAVTGELVLDCETPDRRSSDRRADIQSAALKGSAALEGRPRNTSVPERRRGSDRRSLHSTIGDGLGLYWRYEKAIRRNESAVWSTLGATGAIYAMRRRLWAPLPAETILDDVLAPMRVVLAGFRVVFTDRAVAFDRAAGDAAAETRRKIRTLAGNYQILRLEPRLLVPWRNPVWLQYASHKIGRLAVPYALLAMLASSMVLAGQSLFYAAALGGQCLFYLLAGYGAWLDARSSFAARLAPARASLTLRPVHDGGPGGDLHG